jgi:hypothetical protein
MISSLAGRKVPDNGFYTLQNLKGGCRELIGYYSVLGYLELVRR